jgi:hypothetical protein
MIKEEKQAWGLWIAAMLILLLCLGCGSKKGFTSSQTIKDSTWIKKTVTPIDTAVTIPGNKVGVSAKLEDLTEGKIFENTSKNLTASLRREGNTIIANCNQEELEMIIRLQKELLEVYRSRETDKQETKTVTENKVPWYLVPLVWLGGICLIIILIALLIKFLKPKKLP